MLRFYTAHYNHERPHRGLALLTPEIGDAAGLPTTEKIDRRDRLGGLIHEYPSSRGVSRTGILKPSRGPPVSCGAGD
jgi:hypothetical protein